MNKIYFIIILKIKRIFFKSIYIFYKKIIRNLFKGFYQFFIFFFNSIYSKDQSIISLSKNFYKKNIFFHFIIKKVVKNNNTRVKKHLAFLNTRFIIRKNLLLYILWNFQLNTEVTQQSGEDQPSFDQVEILNVPCEEGEESSLNISLKEVLAAGVVEEIAVIDNEIDRV